MEIDATATVRYRDLFEFPLGWTNLTNLFLQRPVLVDFDGAEHELQLIESCTRPT